MLYENASIPKERIEQSLDIKSASDGQVLTVEKGKSLWRDVTAVASNISIIELKNGDNIIPECKLAFLSATGAGGGGGSCNPSNQTYLTSGGGGASGNAISATPLPAGIKICVILGSGGAGGENPHNFGDSPNDGKDGESTYIIFYKSFSSPGMKFYRMTNKGWVASQSAYRDERPVNDRKIYIDQGSPKLAGRIGDLYIDNAGHKTLTLVGGCGGKSGPDSCSQAKGGDCNSDSNPWINRGTLGGHTLRGESGGSGGSVNHNSTGYIPATQGNAILAHFLGGIGSAEDSSNGGGGAGSIFSSGGNGTIGLTTNNGQDGSRGSGGGGLGSQMHYASDGYQLKAGDGGAGFAQLILL